MKMGLFSYPTPFTPPTTEEDELSFLRLVRSRRVGPATFHRLMAEHGSAAAALHHLPDIARAAGIEDYQPCPEGVAQAELAAGRKAGARLLRHGAQDYPAMLGAGEDAPPVLWTLGCTELLARPAVAVVGARNASSLGLRMARRLAADLGAAGFVVISGLARGIDAAAHEAALPSGTIAVQAGGIDVIYPAENDRLARQIAAEGLRLAELPPGFAPRAQHFPQRNRIIAAQAIATIVVEAAARSGSVVTARIALDLGREVMAVPGHPIDPRAAGCNALIRDGAALIRTAEDVLEILGTPPPVSPCPPREALPLSEAAPTGRADTGDLGARILAALGPAPIAEDSLQGDLAIEAGAMSAALMTLELDGRLIRHPGGLVSRA